MFFEEAMTVRLTKEVKSMLKAIMEANPLFESESQAIRVLIIKYYNKEVKK